MSETLIFCVTVRPPTPLLLLVILLTELTDHDRLAPMISTIDIDNGFRDDLMPMALSNEGKASHGLRNAMLAVSALHLWGPELALSYKAEAIRSLSSSLSTESFGTTETQLATSMMLCVYNVRAPPPEIQTVRELTVTRSLMKPKGTGAYICTEPRRSSTS